MLNPTGRLCHRLKTLISITFGICCLLPYHAHARNVPANKDLKQKADSRQDRPLPSGGVSLLGEDPLSRFHFGGGPESGSSSIVEVTGQPFTKALRLETRKQSSFDYEIETVATTAAPTKKNDLLFVRMYVRCIKGQPETGQAKTTVDFQLGPPNWEKAIAQGVDIPASWKRIDIPFLARFDSEAGKTMLCLRMGSGLQIFEVGGLQLINYGSSVKREDLPITKNVYPGQEPNAPWRKAALERIEKIRKGDLTIHVVDTNGNHVPNAEVEVLMTRHLFPFGTAVAPDRLLSTDSDGDKYRQVIEQNFNRVVIENHLKWPVWEDTGRELSPKSVKWFHDKGIDVRGHNLVWPNWNYLPDDLQKLKDDPKALRARIDNHISDIVTTMKGQLVDWDVVNEPYTNHALMDVLGREEMVHWFQLAHHYDSAARLFLNDYPPLDGAAKQNVHLAAFEDNLRFLRDHGAPLGGIGFQCHIGGDVIPPARLLSGLDRFAAFKLPIAITEFDIDTQDEELKERYMRDFMTAVFSHPAVDSILMWGFWEKQHWLPEAALYGADWSLKPHGKAWQDLVKKQWWTHTKGNTGALGAYKTRGFYGDYQITVTARGHSKQVQLRLQPGSDNSVTVQLEP